MGAPYRSRTHPARTRPTRMQKRIESGHRNPQLCFRATRVSNWVPIEAGFAQMSEVDVGVLDCDVGWLGAARR